MFQLARLADIVQLAPTTFTKPTARAIADEINARYANKVVWQVGLCVGVYDLAQVGDSMIGHGNGAAHVHGTPHSATLY